LILLLLFLLLMDPPEVDVSPPHRCLDEDVDYFRINLPPPSPPPRFFPRSSQLVVLVCGHRWPQVRRQGLTSPNDRFLFYFMDLFFFNHLSSSLQHFLFLFCFLFIFQLSLYWRLSIKRKYAGKSKESRKNTATATIIKSRLFHTVERLHFFLLFYKFKKKLKLPPLLLFGAAKIHRLPFGFLRWFIFSLSLDYRAPYFSIADAFVCFGIVLFFFFCSFYFHLTIVTMPGHIPNRRRR